MNADDIDSQLAEANADADTSPVESWSSLAGRTPLGGISIDEVTADIPGDKTVLNQCLEIANAKPGEKLALWSLDKKQPVWVSYNFCPSQGCYRVGDRFKSVEDFKERAFFFKAGQIIPRWLMPIINLRNGRQSKHRSGFVFMTDAWVVTFHNRLRFCLFDQQQKYENDGMVIALSRQGTGPVRITANRRVNHLWVDNHEQGIVKFNEIIATTPIYHEISFPKQVRLPKRRKFRWEASDDGKNWEKAKVTA